MGLLSFFQNKSSPPEAGLQSAEAIDRARTRARQRLIGAVVLLGIGIVGFPLLFETQPRPVPVDIRIEIPPKDSAPPLALPASRPAPAVITERASDAGRELPAPVVEPTPPKAAQASAPKAAEASPPKALAQASAPKVDDGSRAKALLEAKAAAASAPDAARRFVVQVGAFADANAAREARAKVEKLGLKTYTQEVDTDAGKRIRVRVGPFGTRDDADKAAGRIKSAGLPSAILAL